jgi:hypothetical protein
MPEPTRINEFFGTLAKVLLRCWVLGFVLLFISVGVVLLAGDSVHRLHGEMFGLSKHELELVLYCGIAILKLLILVFFFIPWLAIRLVLRSGKT